MVHWSARKISSPVRALMKIASWVFCSNLNDPFIPGQRSPSFYNIFQRLTHANPDEAPTVSEWKTVLSMFNNPKRSATLHSYQRLLPPSKLITPTNSPAEPHIKVNAKGWLITKASNRRRVGPGDRHCWCIGAATPLIKSVRHAVQLPSRKRELLLALAFFNNIRAATPVSLTSSVHLAGLLWKPRLNPGLFIYPVYRAYLRWRVT